MLAALMLAAALTATRLAPLDDAIEHYRTVETYQVTLRSSHAAGEYQLRYYYRKPGFVRMEFIRPHAGAVRVYSPLTRRVRVWPFGAGRFPELSLNPRNPLIRSRGANPWTNRMSGRCSRMSAPCCSRAGRRWWARHAWTAAPPCIWW